MPRRIVYGKRPASAFALSSIFSSQSSPEKVDTVEEDSDNSVTATAAILKRLEITDKSGKIAERPQARRALSSKDGNVQALKPRGKKDHLKSKDVVQSTDIYNLEPEVPVEDVLEATTPAKQQQPSPAALPISPPQTVVESEAEQDLEIEADPYIQSLLALSTNHRAPQTFTAWSQTLEPFFSISKIAEASYGEVYRLALSQPHPTFTSNDESVLKFLALKPPQLPASEEKKKSKAQLKREGNMSSVPSVVSETQLLKRLTEVPGFTNYRALHILQGRPSPAFIAAWKAWNKSRPAGDKSAFPDPSRKANYTDDQLWAVIEMQDAGTDVERLQELGDESLATVEGVWDVFWQVVFAVGKGEELAEFEHRDLHLGNICVKMGKKRKSASRKLGFTGLESTIIDYTLSRAEMARTRPTSAHSTSSNTSTISSTSSSSNSIGTLEQPEAEIAFLDLMDQPDIFTGDATNEYQYDIYRYMRNAMYFSNALHDYSTHTSEAQATGRSWRGFHPQTNLVWLHFVLRSLIRGVNVNDDEGNSAELRETLQKVEGLLDIKTIPRDGLASVRDLIAVALAEEWLDEEDVVGETVTPFIELDVKRAEKKVRRKEAR